MKIYLVHWRGDLSILSMTSSSVKKNYWMVAKESKVYGEIYDMYFTVFNTKSIVVLLTVIEE